MKKGLLFFILTFISLTFTNCKDDYEFSSKRIKEMKGTGLIDSALVYEFITTYKGHKINVFNESVPVKGFYLDDEILAVLRDTNLKLNGLFLYLAKKTPAYDGKYTLIAIPSTPSKLNPLKDSLIINKALEWHDPITKSQHKPLNELGIGYLQNE